MTLDQFDQWQKSLKALKKRNRLLLVVAAVLMVFLWGFSQGSLSSSQKDLYHKVSDAEKELYQWRVVSGSVDDAVDPFRTGLIGEEWSSLSTTEGALPSKRTATDPRWALVVDQWLSELDVKTGDPVVVMASSSFPGLILNTLMALEHRGLAVTMVLSLGASSWGANVEGITWLDMANHLKSRSMLHTMPQWCTFGGNDETGGGLSNETLEYFEELARHNEIPLIRRASLEEMIQWKMTLIRQVAPKVVFSIGGSHANMGDDPVILKLRPGLHRQGDGGDGVIGKALAESFPVVHMLDLKRLSRSTGIAYDGRPWPLFQSHGRLALAFAGLIVFILALCGFRRWKRWPLSPVSEIEEQNNGQRN